VIVNALSETIRQSIPETRMNLAGAADMGNNKHPLCQSQEIHSCKHLELQERFLKEGSRSTQPRALDEDQAGFGTISAMSP
jgi:hypothetical protein